MTPASSRTVCKAEEEEAAEQGATKEPEQNDSGPESYISAIHC